MIQQFGLIDGVAHGLLRPLKDLFRLFQANQFLGSSSRLAKHRNHFKPMAFKNIRHQSRFSRQPHTERQTQPIISIFLANSQISTMRVLVGCMMKAVDHGWHSIPPPGSTPSGQKFLTSGISYSRLDSARIFFSTRVGHPLPPFPFSDLQILSAKPTSQSAQVGAGAFLFSFICPPLTTANVGQ